VNVAMDDAGQRQASGVLPRRGGNSTPSRTGLVEGDEPASRLQIPLSTERLSRSCSVGRARAKAGPRSANGGERYARARHPTQSRGKRAFWMAPSLAPSCSKSGREPGSSAPRLAESERPGAVVHPLSSVTKGVFGHLHEDPGTTRRRCTRHAVLRLRVESPEPNARARLEAARAERPCSRGKAARWVTGADDGTRTTIAPRQKECTARIGHP
jgi:hypothetical protein